jgi:hypothetical protein
MIRIWQYLQTFCDFVIKHLALAVTKHRPTLDGLAYLFCSPATRRRRRKENPVLRGTTGGHKYRDVVVQVGGRGRVRRLPELSDSKIWS